MVIETNTETDSLFSSVTIGNSTTALDGSISSSLEHIYYNPDTDKIETDRAIETTLNSLYLGKHHKMSSGGENIYFTNLSSGINWYPGWGGVLPQDTTDDNGVFVNQQPGAGTYKPSMRVFEEYTPIALGGQPNIGTSIPYSGSNRFTFNISGLGITTMVAETVPEDMVLKYEIAIGGIPAYVQYLDNHGGKNPNELLTWFFDHPLDITGTEENPGINTVSITKLDSNRKSIGILKVCRGLDEVNFGGIRYQTTVLSRLFTDKNIAYKDELENLPIFYEGQPFFDIYIDITYDNSFEDSDGTLIKPYTSLEDGITLSNPGDRIFIIGDCFITSEIVLPHGLSFYGSDGSSIKYATYNTANTNIFKFTGIDNTQSFKFKNIEFLFAGEYAINILNAKQVVILDCTIQLNGWNGSGISTISPSNTLRVGYDSSKSDLQDFYTNTIQSLDGGAIYINNTTTIQIIGNTIRRNFNSIKLTNCGISGNGFITRNIISENIKSGIYLGTDNNTGCQNMIVSMNYSSYNAYTGISVIGGINNKFSQNEINGNWNAAFFNLSAVNTTFRDSGLYNNNRSIYNGIGEETSKSKASIVIDEADSTTSGEISINADATFIIEVLDTQIHYTGIDTTSTDVGNKTGIYITQNVGNLTDSYKNIIKIDDTGFIGQNYAIDFSQVNVSSLRLSLGDNSYQSISVKTIKDPLGGMYSELPYSNHVMQVPEVDIHTDLNLKKTIKLCEGPGGHVINVYHVNELESILDGNKINIIQKNTNKIQLRGLELTKVYINGVLPTANDISSLNDTINAAFSMTSDQFENFLVSDVGLDGRNTLPVRDNIWKQQFGPQANTIITTNIVTDANKNIQPFRYIPHSNLRKGKEYIWTHDDTEDYILGFWNNGNSSSTHNETDVFLPVKWIFAFKFTENLVCNTTNGSVGSDIDTQHINGYSISNSTILALRYSHDNYIYLLDITNGSNTLIAKTNTTQGNIRFSFGGGLNSKIPIIRETSSIWDIVHDLSASENKEWIDGINSKTVLRSNMKIYPNQKITLNFDYLGKDETIGMLYNGAYFNNSNAPTSLRYYLKYSSTTEVLVDPTNSWIFDTTASNYDSVLEGWGRGEFNSLGVISFIYKSDNSIELFSQTENQTIATLRYKIRDPFLQIYFGADTSPHTLSEIPDINKFAIINTEIYPYNQTWYFIESPDGNFHYPLFKNVLEARGVDLLLGGTGTNHSHVYDDDPTNTTWYMPIKHSVMNHINDIAPKNGIWNNLTNILWNEISTNADDGYKPSSYTNQEHTYLEDTTNISIQYKPLDSNSYTLTGLPPGWTQGINTINGNAETITFNGYGNLKTYVVYVTKANAYGSVVGTITINIKPNLASNEFQVIEIETTPGVVDDIKFTLDYGLTQIDPGFIGYNATSTYKFYLDDGSVESNDVLDIVLESDNSVVYSTGVTNIGSVSSAGAYLQFVIPEDVPPVKLRWTSGTGEVIIKPLNINGSTYSPPVTGISHEGPDTLNVNVADSSTWYSIDTQFAKERRILLPGTLLKEIASELGDINSNTTGSSILIGLKEPSWLNSKDGFASSNTGFLHEMAIKISRGSVGEYLLNVRKDGISNYGNFTVEFTSLADIETNGGAFIEIIPSGDAFRMCITNNATNLDIVTRTEATWGVNKITTGNQNFNITNIDLMIYFDKQEEDFNYSTIDWTQITSIPTLIDLVTTNWYKSLDFKASNQYTILPRIPNTDFAGSGNRSIIFPLSMNDFAKTIPDDATNSTKFSNDADARPWSLATVFMIDGNNSDQLILGQIEGSASDQDNIMLKVNASKVLSLHWGRNNDITGLAYNVYNIQTITINTWYGLYIEHTGCRYNAADSTSTNLNKALHFKFVDLTSGVVTDNPGTWTITGHSINLNIRGEFMIGGRTTDKSFNGKVASCVVTTQLRGDDYPVNAEVSMMVRDPVKWLTNYKIGQNFRVSNDGNVYSSVFALNDDYSSYSTQVWLMGDTGLDSFPSIKNYVYPASITTPLDMTNMLSTDIETINIPELN